MTPSLARRLARPAVHRLERLPLQTRLIAVLLALLLVALTLTSLATAFLMRRDLVAEVDKDLAIQAVPVATVALDSIRQDRVATLPSGYAVVLVPADGSIPRGIYSASESEYPDIPWLPVDDPVVQDHRPFTVGSTNGQLKWRVMPGPLSDNSASYFVAVPLREAERTVKRLVLVTAAIGLAVVGATTLLGYFVTRRAFRPLRRIEATAAAIAAGDLTQRVPVRHSKDEVGSLTTSLNHMLAQVERAFAAQQATQDRMRRFVADASHELRTPLVTVRGYAELYRQGAITRPEDVSSAMGRIEAEASRMSTLVEDLLQLARLDDQRPMELTDVDLTVVAADIVQDARVRDGARQIALHGLDGDLAPAIVRGDEARLRQVLTNLVANALNHTPDGTPVEVLVGGGRGEVVVQVRDHGPGLSGADLERVFERFYRADSSRVRGQGGGNGLGLAIVAAIAAAHGGTVRAEPTPGGGATFVVRLPRHTP
ncbi:MAG: HAMP domain-containing histidine kinase [Micrococcales bacterium]|nr:HAMP domain-containing histidine kinase [Micrococcales bacterium]